MTSLLTKTMTIKFNEIKRVICVAVSIAGILLVFPYFVVGQSCPNTTTVSGNSVTFVGELTDLGGDSVTAVWFEYGKTLSYGQRTVEYNLSQPGLYCITVSGLDPCSTYNYRAVARNSAGTSFGANQSFTTTCPSTSLSVSKLVRNATKGTSFLDSVFADPGDIVSFQIELTVFDQPAQNVILFDSLPSRFVFQSNSLKVDGVSVSGNILSGLNLGNLLVNQKKTVTFDAQVAGAENFSFGENQLINTAMAYTTTIARSDTAKVIVQRAAVAGAATAATAVPTGLTNNIWFDSLVIPFTIALLFIWLLKKKIIRFDQWIDSLKVLYQRYRSEKTLKAKIKAARLEELKKELGKKSIS